VNTVRWTDPKLIAITALQLVKVLDCYRVAYCSGRTATHEKVLVILPFTKLPLKYKWEIVKWAKRDGVYAAGLNIFDVVET